MSNVISILLFLGWEPVEFHTWKDNNGIYWHLNSRVPPLVCVKALVDSYVDRELERASQHFDGAGLDGGVDWDSTLHIIRNAKKENMLKIKSVLESIMSACMWPLCRIHAINPNVAKLCPRCGAREEDSWHCYWGCHKNAEIDSPSMRDTQNLAHQALSDGANECMWLRGLLPKSKTTYK